MRFFLLAVTYWLTGDLTIDVPLKATPDLLLAVIFEWWPTVPAESRGAINAT